MKKYLVPNMEINRFEIENIVTGSAYKVEEWGEQTTGNKAEIDWNKDLQSVQITSF